MRHLLLSICWTIIAAGVVCAGDATSLEWETVRAGHTDLQGEIVAHGAPDGKSALLIENKTSEPKTFTVAVLIDPAITNAQYTVSGQVRYADVDGDGYLEMWSHFGNAQFFTRTLGESGPMGKLRGSSDWREFKLPFDSTGSPTKLSKLVLNVVLPAKGKVWLGPLTAPKSTPAAKGSAAWWSDSTGGIIGGIFGCLFGILIPLCMWLAMRGKARGFVTGFCIGNIVLGALVLTAGIVAVSQHQPYGVYYVLLLLGSLLIVFGAMNLGRARRYFEAAELRKMAAADA